MQMLIFAMVHAVLLLFYGVLGMTLLPAASRRDKSRDTLFLVAPLLGAGVWTALTVGIGLVLPYNAGFLGAMLALAAVWTVFRRKTLFLPENPSVWGLLAVIVVLSALLGRYISPTEIDGGLYFVPSVYDHVKCAIINSISAHGLPPVNPWLAEGGKPLALIYYFGWHAWAAQLRILAACGAYFTECAMTSFTFAIILAGIAALVTGFNGGSFRRAVTACLFFLIVFDTSSTDMATVLLPESWTPFLTSEMTSGFWTLKDNCYWSPQHLFAAGMVLLVLHFHNALLRSEDSKTAAANAVIMGLLAAAAAFTSIYAGVFALLVIIAVMVYDYCRKREFRVKFNRALGWQIAAVLLCLALTAFYVKYLLAHPSENNPLGLGIMPCFGKIDHFWQYPLYFLQFYFIILPLRLGVTYVFGMLAIFWPGVVPEHPLANFCKRYVVVSFLVIFFVHTTFYSNDFGWRLICAPQILLVVFAVFFFRKIYHWLISRVGKKRKAAAIVAPLVGIFLYICGGEYCINHSLLKFDDSLHRDFARAVPGWKVVQAHTGKDDLVLCNPAGFREMGQFYAVTTNSTFHSLYAGFIRKARKSRKMLNISTNVFFSLYAHRETPIADLIFSKCYSEFFPQEKLEKLYGKVVAIFNGSPSKGDADYLADDLRVRAILVTPRDGLWQNPGRIDSRFPMKEETADYRVYWREK